MSCLLLAALSALVTADPTADAVRDTVYATMQSVETRFESGELTAHFVLREGALGPDGGLARTVARVTAAWRAGEHLVHVEYLERQASESEPSDTAQLFASQRPVRVVDRYWGPAALVESRQVRLEDTDRLVPGLLLQVQGKQTMPKDYEFVVHPAAFFPNQPKWLQGIVEAFGPDPRLREMTRATLRGDELRLEAHDLPGVDFEATASLAAGGHLTAFMHRPTGDDTDSPRAPGEAIRGEFEWAQTSAVQWYPRRIALTQARDRRFREVEFDLLIDVQSFTSPLPAERIVGAQAVPRLPGVRVMEYQNDQLVREYRFGNRVPPPIQEQLDDAVRWLKEGGFAAPRD